MTEGPPLFTGGARRSRRHARRSRRRHRSDRARRRGFRRTWLLVPVAGLAALAAILTSSSGNGGDATQPGQTARPGSLAQPAKQPDQLPGAAGGGEASRFAVNLTGPDLVRLRFGHRPRAGLLFDTRSGRVLWRLNPTRRLPIASLTKMMTALLVVERRSPHERVRISARARHTQGSAGG